MPDIKQMNAFLETLRAVQESSRETSLAHKGMMEELISAGPRIGDDRYSEHRRLAANLFGLPNVEAAFLRMGRKTAAECHITTLRFANEILLFIRDEDVFYGRILTICKVALAIDEVDKKQELIDILSDIFYALRLQCQDMRNSYNYALGRAQGQTLPRPQLVYYRYTNYLNFMEQSIPLLQLCPADIPTAGEQISGLDLANATLTLFPKYISPVQRKIQQLYVIAPRLASNTDEFPAFISNLNVQINTIGQQAAFNRSANQKGPLFTEYAAICKESTGLLTDAIANQRQAIAQPGIRDFKDRMQLKRRLAELYLRIEALQENTRPAQKQAALAVTPAPAAAVKPKPPAAPKPPAPSIEAKPAPVDPVEEERLAKLSEARIQAQKKEAEKQKAIDEQNRALAAAKRADKAAAKPAPAAMAAAEDEEDETPTVSFEQLFEPSTQPPIEVLERLKKLHAPNLKKLKELYAATQLDLTFTYQELAKIAKQLGATVSEPYGHPFFLFDITKPGDTKPSSVVCDFAIPHGKSHNSGRLGGAYVAQFRHKLQAYLGITRSILDSFNPAAAASTRFTSALA